jgi:plasmid maintenance system antidote protein VapI
MMAKRRTPSEPSSLADQLRQAIIDSGQSHYALAKSTGIAQPIVTRFVNGTRSISLESASALAAYFEMTLTVRRPPRS